MKQSYRTAFYNLDAILSVGYRVNSRNAIIKCERMKKSAAEG